MKRMIVILLVFLFIIWSGFIIWELHMDNWFKIEKESKIRVDLVVILPIIIGITLYVIDAIIHISKRK